MHWTQWKLEHLGYGIGTWSNCASWYSFELDFWVWVDSWHSLFPLGYCCWLCFWSSWYEIWTVYGGRYNKHEIWAKLDSTEASGVEEWDHELASIHVQHLFYVPKWLAQVPASCFAKSLIAFCIFDFCFSFSASKVAALISMANRIVPTICCINAC